MLRKLAKNITRILSDTTVRSIFVSLSLMIVEVLVVVCATLI